MSKQSKTKRIELRITEQELTTWREAKQNINNTSELIRKSVNYYIYRVAEG